MIEKKTRAQRFVEEQLKDPVVAAAFSEGLEELRLSVKIAQLREQRGLTQTQLAARMRTSAPVISRLESGGKCTLRTLKKVADALDAVLQIELIPKEKLRRPSKAA
jgi:ribosome-binding protein aMBF1 (putative translation factor)